MDTPHTAPLPWTAPAPRPADESATLRDVVRLLGGTPAEVEAIAAATPVAMRRLDQDATLVHERAALHSLYVVRCGSLKCLRTLEDGYEQVTAFALPADVLGFDGLHEGRHATSDVALEYSTVYALPLSGLRELRQQSPALDRLLQLALSRQLARAATTADMLAAVSSEVRLARFVLWMAVRASELGWSPRRLRLRMCRRDMASLLGIAHETVSRCFTTLAEAGLLHVHNREIEILDLAGLQARARATRRPADPGANVGGPRLPGASPAGAGAPRSLSGMAAAA